MSSSVTVKVPARLHLGFLDPSGGAGRRFGSVGLPLSEPETVISLSRAATTSIEGPDGERAARHLAALSAHLGIRAHHRLVVREAIPAHAGLGSGTQIALAVAAALRTLHGVPLEIEADAIRLARGGRSGIGIASFADGGVIIDAGRDRQECAPPVIARLPFPAEWRAMLVLDRSESGLHGEDEAAAFRALPPISRNAVGEICRLVLMGLMPALAQTDFTGFSDAVSALQLIVGEHFAPAQGGIFTSRRVERVVRRLEARGAGGIGQSSWGPTGFAFARSEDEALLILAGLSEAEREGTDIRVVSGRNEGAAIEVTGLGLVAN